MFILVGMGGLLVLLGVSISPHGSEAIIAAIFIFVFNILLCLKLDHAPPPVWKAVRSAPKFIWRQLVGLLKMADPNKNFIHTEHKKMVSVDDVLEK